MFNISLKKYAYYLLFTFKSYISWYTRIELGGPISRPPMSTDLNLCDFL